MRAIGVRELKNRLSEYLRLVRGGERVLVTDRGKVVAELGPPGMSARRTRFSHLLELQEEGRLRLGATNDASCYSKAPVSLEEREILALLNEVRGPH
jgi:antitoxin (DNA-binding transcriptional repressor) of toxin-antitoxin stability system